MRPEVALIREEDCIGCVKCIQACPVDAILGAEKYMHTVIAEECIGCELCIAPCPTNCIAMIPMITKVAHDKALQAKHRVQARKTRLQLAEQAQTVTLQKTLDRSAVIRAAIARVQAKKTTDEPTKTP